MSKYALLDHCTGYFHIFQDMDQVDMYVETHIESENEIEDLSVYRIPDRPLKFLKDTIVKYNLIDHDAP